MSIFTDLLPVVGGYADSLIAFLVVLGVVVFIHEYGHYIVGRWSGIHAEEFSLGFGPEIFGWTDKRGTRWRVSWVPLGGYVRFKGDADAASARGSDEVKEMSPQERRQTLSGAPLWARSATVAAGPFANFLLSTVIFGVVAFILGRPSPEPVLGPLAAQGQAALSGFEEGDQILAVDGEPIESLGGFVGAMFEKEGVPRQVRLRRDGVEQEVLAAFSESPRVMGVRPDGAAARACMKPGDSIIAINDQPISSFSELRTAILASDQAEQTFKIQRGAELLELSVAPQRVEHLNPETGQVEMRVMIGVSGPNTLGIEGAMASIGPLEALGVGVSSVWRTISGTFSYLGAWMRGDVGGASLGGPLGIAEASGRSAQAGGLTFLLFIASVSTAIGLINLFPIPVLDGGHLVFYGLEALRGRPVGERWVEYGMRAGLMAILLLLVFATYNDLGRWFASAAVEC